MSNQQHNNPTSHPMSTQSSSRTLAASIHRKDTDPDPDSVDLEANEPEKALERLYSSHHGEAPGAVTATASSAAATAVDLPAQNEKGKGNEDEFLVTLVGREGLNPHTWGVGYRWFLTVFTGILVLNCTFASSAPSNLIPEIIEHFGVSEEVGILTISLFVAGYCVGPFLWGPLSERFGRKPIFVVSFLPYTLFQMACALAPNIGSLLAFRFIGGCFAAAPLTNVGGVIADMWGPDQRGDALAVFALMPFAGPAIAPIVSGFIAVTGTSYKWIFWVLTIFAGTFWVLVTIILPETYVPILLKREAAKLRKETGNPNWISALERSQAAETPRMLLKKTVAKPFIMIVEEPMLLVLTLYMSFVYGILYLLFEAIPIVFGQTHHLNSGKVGLVFLALLVGCIIGVVSYVGWFNPQYIKLHHRIAPRAVPPEERLRPMLYAAPLFAAAFFWFGWTGNYSTISIWAPITSVVFLGFGVIIIFVAVFNYLIDAYLMNAASALSINTVVRSTFGAGFPLFAGQMYRKLGTGGASSLLGGLAILFIPAPVILMKYGPKLRAMSKNAVVRANE